MKAIQFVRAVALVAGAMVFPIAFAETPTEVINPCLLLAAAEEAEFGLKGAEKEIVNLTSSPGDGQQAERPKFRGCSYKLTSEAPTTIQVVSIAPVGDGRAAEGMLNDFRAAAKPGTQQYVPGAVVSEIDGGACGDVPFMDTSGLAMCLGVREGLVLWIILRSDPKARILPPRTHALFEDVALRLRAFPSLAKQAEAEAARR